MTNKYPTYNQLSPGSLLYFNLVYFSLIYLLSISAERTTLEPVSHELGSGGYGSLHPNLTELGSEMPPTTMSQLRK